MKKEAKTYDVASLPSVETPLKQDTRKAPYGVLEIIVIGVIMVITAIGTA